MFLHEVLELVLLTLLELLFVLEGSFPSGHGYFRKQFFVGLDQFIKLVVHELEEFIGPHLLDRSNQVGLLFAESLLFQLVVFLAVHLLLMVLVAAILPLVIHCSIIL